MLFSEIYSCYYYTVSEIIKASINGTLDSKTINKIIKDHAFAESNVDISHALKSKRWPLIKDDNSSVIRNIPNTPLSLLEKRWLKSLLNDPRVKLFDISEEGLEDITPLYDEDVFVRFDIYTDGDPYTDPQYIENFRTILAAIKQKRMLKITYIDNNQEIHSCNCTVDNLEYSFKNNKFRVIAVNDSNTIIINLATITSCSLSDEEYTLNDMKAVRLKKEIEAVLEDKNNALNRAMICFSYLEKETIKIDDTHYIFKLKYFEEDEAEILIQILSFGTSLKLTKGKDFIDKIKNRVNKQTALKNPF